MAAAPSHRGAGTRRGRAKLGEFGVDIELDVADQRVEFLATGLGVSWLLQSLRRFSIPVSVSGPPSGCGTVSVTAKPRLS